MSESSDALAAKVMAAVTRHTGVTKSSGQHAVLEAVVGGLCELSATMRITSTTRTGCSRP